MITCFMCGACCKVFDISSLNKPAGVPCERLGKDNRCERYAERPEVCGAYKPDEVCVLLSTLKQDEREALLKYIYYGE